MAALRPCPSGLVVGAPRPSIGCTSHVRILGRRSTSSLLKMSWGGSGTTAANLQHRYPIRAHNGAADYWPIVPDPDDDKPMTEEEFNKFREELKKRCKFDKDMPFGEDVEKIDEYQKKMTSWNTSIFHMEGTQFSLNLCFIAKNGVKMASRIMDSAVLRPDKQDEISLDTTKKTLAKGVAAISHILLQDTLVRVKYDEDISSRYNFVHDKDNGWREFEQELNNLEDKFREVSKSTESYKLLTPTMDGAMILTLLFVSKMNGRLKMALGKLPDKR